MLYRRQATVMLSLILLNLLWLSPSSQRKTVPAAPTFVDFPNRVVRTDKCIDAIKLIAEGKFSQICLGDNPTENYACNPLDDEDKGAQMLYLTPAERKEPEVRKQHTSLGYYCSNKVKLPDQEKDEENNVTYSAINLECHGEVFPVPDMHKIMQICFNSSEVRLKQDGLPMPSMETCQDNSLSDLRTSDDISTVYDGLKNQDTDKQKKYHTGQEWPLTYVHQDNQRIVLKQPRMTSAACYWKIVALFRYGNLRIQDIKMRIKELENVDVFMTSMFLDFKESNTTYHTRVKQIYENNEALTFEMYNKTYFYVIPIDPSKPQKFELDFWVLTTQIFLYGDKYQHISVLISFGGSFLLIIGIVAYLGGFATLGRYIVQKYNERKTKKEEEQLLRNQEAGETQGRFERQESNETGNDEYRKNNGGGVKSGFPTELQDGEEGSDLDDMQYPRGGSKGHGHSHEGGRNQRPGSSESDMPPGQIRKSKGTNVVRRRGRQDD